MTQMHMQESKIGTYSCDYNKIAKLSGILQETQEAGRIQMAVNKPSYEDLQEAGQGMMLSRLDLKIYDTIRFDEPLVVSTWACDSSRATFLRRYVIERAGQVVVDASSQWVLVDLNTRKVLKVDEVDFSNYYMGEYKELFDSKLRIPRDTNFEELNKYEICYSDLDYNKHMNNTYYADVLCDRIPELAEGTHRVESFRIHYKNEAALGETITVMRNQNAENSYLFRTIRNDGEINIDSEITLVKL